MRFIIELTHMVKSCRDPIIPIVAFFGIKLYPEKVGFI